MDWAQLSAVLGVFSALFILHSKIVVPQIISECRKQWTIDIANAEVRTLKRLRALGFNLNVTPKMPFQQAGDVEDVEES